jgi:hypothetical protein
MGGPITNTLSSSDGHDAALVAGALDAFAGVTHAATSIADFGIRTFEVGTRILDAEVLHTDLTLLRAPNGGTADLATESVDALRGSGATDFGARKDALTGPTETVLSTFDTGTRIGHTSLWLTAFTGRTTHPSAVGRTTLPVIANEVPCALHVGTQIYAALQLACESLFTSVHLAPWDTDTIGTKSVKTLRALASIVTIGATIAFVAALALTADRALVKPTIAVVIELVAGLRRDTPTGAALVPNAFVDHAVTVVVGQVTRLGPQGLVG